MQQTESVLSDIIRAVAASKNVDPTELDYQLYDYIELDAIEQLVDHGSSTWSLSFRLPDQIVFVRCDQEVTVESIPTADTHPPGPEANNTETSLRSAMGDEGQEDREGTHGCEGAPSSIRSDNRDTERPVTPSRPEATLSETELPTPGGWTREETGRVTRYTHCSLDFRVSVLELYGSVPKSARSGTRPSKEPVFVVRKQEPTRDRPVHVSTTKDAAEAIDCAHAIMAGIDLQEW